MNSAFALWGFTGIELLIDAGNVGPSPEQAEAFRRFHDAKEALLPRCLRAVDAVREGLGVPPGEFRISGLTIPSLATGPAARTWTLWFDLAGDDHYMYGVETDDDWESLGAFADD